MILFGHLGLTYAAAAALEKGSRGGKGADLLQSGLLQSMDCRVLFIGSVLPDLIDKLVILMIAGGSFHSGRIFAHSLLFVAVLSIIDLLVWKKSRKRLLLILSFGSFVHLIFDSMWLYIDTLLWPVYDLSVRKPQESILTALGRIIDRDFSNVSLLSLKDALMNPFISIPELLGLGIMTYLFLQLIKTGRIKAFLLTGVLPAPYIFKKKGKV